MYKVFEHDIVYINYFDEHHVIIMYILHQKQNLIYSFGFITIVVAGVSPLVGLWTTVTLGFFAALFGGRAGIMSSASGACSVVVAALCASHGSGYLAGCAALAGILQIVAGSAGLGKLIRLVPHPVMIGFVNGLSLVMLKAQLTHFKSAGKFLSLVSPEGRATYGCALLTMALVRFGIPKLQEKVEVVKAVPPTLGGVVISSAIASFFKWPIKTLAGKTCFSTTFELRHF